MKLKEPLSKRNYIAIKAMQSMIQSKALMSVTEISDYSYLFANSMIKEGNKIKNGGRGNKKKE